MSCWHQWYSYQCKIQFCLEKLYFNFRNKRKCFYANEDCFAFCQNTINKIAFDNIREHFLSTFIRFSSNKIKWQLHRIISLIKYLPKSRNCCGFRVNVVGFLYAKAHSKNERYFAVMKPFFSFSFFCFAQIFP